MKIFIRKYGTDRYTMAIDGGWFWRETQNGFMTGAEVIAKIRQLRRAHWVEQMTVLTK